MTMLVSRAVSTATRPVHMTSPTTFLSAIRLNVERLCDAPVFHFLPSGDVDASMESLSFGALDARARAVAAHLAELDLVGQRALLLYAPGLDFMVAFVACLYSGV